MKVSREQMMAVLRSQNIYNLGEVRRLYIEACGLFSVFKYPKPKPGLPLLPPYDDGAGTELEVIDGVSICSQCGNPANNQAGQGGNCSNCGENNWISAVIAK